jgi:hypothetical protein
VAAIAGDYRLVGGTVGDLIREARGVAVPARPAASPSRGEKPMSHNTHEPELVVVPLWTRARAVKARPYLASMLRSLRDSLLKAKQHGLAAHRLATRPGRLNRASLIARAEAIQESRVAYDAVDDGMEELRSLGINCLDPVQGEALVPFLTRQQLAWFIYDLFAEEPLRHWRFNTDPPETRRPIEEIHSNPKAGGRPSEGNPPTIPGPP